MSAYVCDREHLVYLVSAAMSRRLNPHGGAFSWYWHGPTQPAGLARAELPCSDYDRAADVANMLLRENIASVSARYPNESSATLPGPNDSDEITPRSFRINIHEQFAPVQVLKSIACLRYQSCEHDAWEASEAYAFLRALESHAIRALHGYEDAAWGAPRSTRERMAA